MRPHTVLTIELDDAEIRNLLGEAVRQRYPMIGNGELTVRVDDADSDEEILFKLKAYVRLEADSVVPELLNQSPTPKG